MSGNSTDVNKRLSAVIKHGYNHAPALRDLMDSSNVAPDAIRSVGDLEQLPVTKKEDLPELQSKYPPFGGFLTVDNDSLRRIFVSPGPIYDPQVRDMAGYGFQEVFRSAGLEPGDVVLNTWSYHLVPAGLVMDEALTDIGVTVVPGGVGNRELQAQMIMDLGVTVIMGSTAFFVSLTEQLREQGHKLPEDWKVKTAILGGEMGDWLSKRRRLEDELSIKTVAFYATAEFGVIGAECDQVNGYHLVDDLIVQICDGDGRPVEPGVAGEIVVTSLNEKEPLVRFGTGDASFIRPEPCPCGRPSPVLAPLVGRMSNAVKIREIFVYPKNIEDIQYSLDEVEHTQAIVTKPGSRDHVTLLVEATIGDEAQLVERIEREFVTRCRIRVDAVEMRPPGSLDREEPRILDQRWGEAK